MSPILGSIGSLAARAFGFGKYVSSASPITGAYDALATVTLASTTASIVFAGIPSTYTHLQLRVMGRTVYAANGDSNVAIYYNGDTTAGNYYGHQLYGSGSAAGSTAASGSRLGFRVPDDSISTSAFGVAVVDILDYANTSKNKVSRALDGWDSNGSGYMYLHSLMWNNTSAVNSITLTPEDGSWKTGSTISLYGVK